MKYVYVLKYIDVCVSNEPLSSVLGVYKTLALAQKDMRQCVKSDIQSAKEREQDFEKELGKQSALIKFDNDDFIEYEITKEQIKEGK